MTDAQIQPKSEDQKKQRAISPTNLRTILCEKVVLSRIDLILAQNRYLLGLR